MTLILMEPSGDQMYLTQLFMSDQAKRKSRQPLILAVEDNDDNLLLISYTLESLGCRFLCQKDGSTTVLVAKEYQPELIMLDILLPGQNGIDIVSHLKQEPLTRDIPVVAVTALASREDRQRIMNAGFDEYLSKPYMIEDLEAVIRRLLCDKFQLQSAYQ